VVCKCSLNLQRLSIACVNHAKLQTVHNAGLTQFSQTQIDYAKKFLINMFIPRNKEYLNNACFFNLWNRPTCIFKDCQFRVVQMFFFNFSLHNKKLDHLTEYTSPKVHVTLNFFPFSFHLIWRRVTSNKHWLSHKNAI